MKTLLAWLILSTLALAALGPAKQTVAVPTRNGNTLATDIYLPSDYSKGKYPQGLPTVLIITPYDQTCESAAKLWRETLVRNGYAFVAQDMRGKFGSEGAGAGVSRHSDGYETVKWIAGCTNDLFGYLPSRKVLEEGGYETRGLFEEPGFFAPKAETVVIGKVAELAKKAGRRT